MPEPERRGGGILTETHLCVLSFAAALQGRYCPSLKRTVCGSERFSDLSSSHSIRTPASFLSFQLTAHLQGPRFFSLHTIHFRETSFFVFHKNLEGFLK